MDMCLFFCRGFFIATTKEEWGRFSALKKQTFEEVSKKLIIEFIPKERKWRKPVFQFLGK